MNNNKYAPWGLLLAGLIMAASASAFDNGASIEVVDLVTESVPTPNFPVEEALPSLTTTARVAETGINDQVSIAVGGTLNINPIGQVIDNLTPYTQRITDPLAVGLLPKTVGDFLNGIIDSDSSANALPIAEATDTLAEKIDDLQCQLMTPPSIQLNFDNVSTSMVKRDFNINVLCPEGVDFGVKSASRGLEKSRFVMLMKNDAGRTPALMDVRHASGQSLAGLTFTGNGEVQTVSMQALLVASNGKTLSGDLLPVEPISILLERK